MSVSCRRIIAVFGVIVAKFCKQTNRTLIREFTDTNFTQACLHIAFTQNRAMRTIIRAFTDTNFDQKCTNIKQCVKNHKITTRDASEIKYITDTRSKPARTLNLKLDKE